MNREKTIVDVLKSGQIVAWQDHEEGADTYVSIITWNGNLTLNLWQGLAGDGAWFNLDCLTLGGEQAWTERTAAEAAEKWIERIIAQEQEELNGAPLGLDQEGEKFLDEQIAKADAEERHPVIPDLEPPPTVRKSAPLPHPGVMTERFNRTGSFR